MTTIMAPATPFVIRIEDKITHRDDIPKNGLWFPVAPSEFAINNSSTWNTYRTTHAGERLNRGGSNLRSIEIEALLPFMYDARLCRGLRSSKDFMRPEEFCRRMDSLCINQVVFRFIIGGDRLGRKSKSSMLMVLSEFSWAESATGPFGSRTVSCRFVEYKVSIDAIKGIEQIKPIPKKYTLRQGEDLQDAALRIFGDIKMAPAIAAANKIPTATKSTKGTKGTGKVTPNAGANIRVKQTVVIPGTGEDIDLSKWWRL